ncbi:MAG: hypothetical protein HOQ02_06265 [Lysobacter sp.]|nr:hypothetical protein [Lysobacter sp.]
MDKSNLPCIDLDAEHLAQVCEERAHALQARAWRSEAERDALREATADLLNAVARQLGAATLAPTPVSAPGLSPTELRETLATRVVHQPLHAEPVAGARHAWVRCFEPGEPPES